MPIDLICRYRSLDSHIIYLIRLDPEDIELLKIDVKLHT